MIYPSKISLTQHWCYPYWGCPCKICHMSNPFYKACGCWSSGRIPMSYVKIKTCLWNSRLAFLISNFVNKVIIFSTNLVLEMFLRIMPLFKITEPFFKHSKNKHTPCILLCWQFRYSSLGCSGPNFLQCSIDWAFCAKHGWAIYPTPLLDLTEINYEMISWNVEKF